MMNVYLTEPIKIQKPIPLSDGQGGHPKTYADVAAVKAMVEELSGRELFYAQQIRAEVTHKVTILWRSDIKNNMRIIRENTSILRIESVLTKDRGGFTATGGLLEIMCVEVKTSEN
jgi:SPP1 family predicted phage head-tail adaptor